MSDKLLNLPSYFLADLPPDAALTPGLITEACQTLKRNRRRYLESRTTGSLLQCLDALGRDWLESDYPFRRHVLEGGPEAMGFSAAVLAAGLDSFFQQLTAENLEGLLRQELGHPRRLDDFFPGDHERNGNRVALARGPQLLAHIAPGNIPSAVMLDMVLGLLARSAQFVKCASGQAFHAAPVCPFSLRGGRQARRLPGGRRMAGRHGKSGGRALRRGGLRGRHGQRRNARGHSEGAAGTRPLCRLRDARQFRLRGQGGLGRAPSGNGRGPGRAGCGGVEPAWLSFPACHLRGGRRPDRGGTIRRLAGRATGGAGKDASARAVGGAGSGRHRGAALDLRSARRAFAGHQNVGQRGIHRLDGRAGNRDALPNFVPEPVCLCQGGDGRAGGFAGGRAGAGEHFHGGPGRPAGRARRNWRSNSPAGARGGFARWARCRNRRWAGGTTAARRWAIC